MSKRISLFFRCHLTLIFLIFIFIFCVGFVAYANAKSQKKSALKEKPAETVVMNDVVASDRLKTLFPNFRTNEIKQSPVSGLWEIDANNQIIYFDPKGGYLLFGDILTKEGKNLTEDRRNEISTRKVGQLPLDKAVKVGNGQNKIIIFTDPDCPFCKKLASHLSSKQDITQFIFFFPLRNLHPLADVKCSYILGAENSSAAYQDIESGKLEKTDWKSISQSEKGIKRLQEHIGLANSLNITSTPSVWVNGKFVAGANLPLIDKLLTQSKNEARNLSGK